MNKNKMTVLLLAILCFVAGSYWYPHRSMEAVLEGIEAPFAVGEVVFNYPIEKNTTMVIYLNKENTYQLQNAIIRKKGFYYKAVDVNGSLEMAEPTKLESGKLRAQTLSSWYDKSDKYVVMSVVYDEEVNRITYNNQTLVPIPMKGYNIFCGAGKGKYEVYKLYDQKGSEMTPVKSQAEI